MDSKKEGDNSTPSIQQPSVVDPNTRITQIFSMMTIIKTGPTPAKMATKGSKRLSYIDRSFKEPQKGDIKYSKLISENILIMYELDPEFNRRECCNQF